MGDTHLVGTSVLDPYKFVGGAAINRQCYGDYFYGADGALDDLLRQGEIDPAPVMLKSPKSGRSLIPN